MQFEFAATSIQMPQESDKYFSTHVRQQDKALIILAVSLCLMVNSSLNILCRSNEGFNACSLVIIASSFGVLRPADSDKQTVSNIIVPVPTDTQAQSKKSQ